MSGTLVIGSLPRIVVPVARALHERGIPVHGASIGNANRTIRSRAFLTFTPIESADGANRIDFADLRSIVERHGIDTILPCGDEVIQALAPHDEEIRKVVHYCGPTPEQCRAILEKGETLALARSLSIPFPATHHLGSRTELHDRGTQIRFPVVVKPRNKEAETATGIKSEICPDFAALDEYFERYPEFGAWFLIQEYLPGYGVALEILLHDGQPIARFQHRRLRELPVRGGVSVSAISEPVDPGMFAYALNLLRGMSWEGVAMVEFRKDPATGRVGLMEVNGRFWGSVALSLECGVNFPYYVWQLAHSIEPKPVADYPFGRKFRWFAGDLKRVYECLVAKTGQSERIGTAIARLLLGSPPAAKDALWAWRDPVPAVEEAARALVSIALMGAGKLATNILPASLYRQARSLRREGLARTAAYLKLKFVHRHGTLAQWNEPVKRILFICHGNIIRSAMAEVIFRAAEPAIEARSAGTAAVPGRLADARAMVAAQENGLSLNDHTATPLSPQLVNSSDLLIVMDYLNMASLLSKYPQAAHKAMLLDSGPAGATEIADPYDGAMSDVRATFQRVQLAVGKLVEQLLQRRNQNQGNAPVRN